MACKNIGQFYIEPDGADAGHLKGLGWFDPTEGDDPLVLDIDDSRVVGVVIEVELANCFRFNNDFITEAFRRVFGLEDGTNRRFVIPNRCGDKPPDREWSHYRAMGKIVFNDNGPDESNGCLGETRPYFPCNNHAFVPPIWDRQLGELGCPPESVVTYPPLSDEYFPSAQFYLGHGVTSGGSFGGLSFIGGPSFCPPYCELFNPGDPISAGFGHYPIAHRCPGTGSDIQDNQLMYFNMVYYRNAGAPPADKVAPFEYPDVCDEFGCALDPRELCHCWEGGPWPARSVGFHITVHDRETAIGFTLRSGWNTPRVEGDRNIFPTEWKVPLYFPVHYFTGCYAYESNNQSGTRESYDFGLEDGNIWNNTGAVIKIVDVLLDQPVWGNCCSPLADNGNVPPGYWDPHCYHTDRTFCEGVYDDEGEFQYRFGFPFKRIRGVFAGGVPGGQGGLCQSPDRCNVNGACCFNNWPGNPICVDDISPELCIMNEGRFWAGPGTMCSDDPCGEEGACCLIDGECLHQFAEQCRDVLDDGLWIDPIWNGPGTLCRSRFSRPPSNDGTELPGEGGVFGTPDDFVQCEPRGKCCYRQLPFLNTTCRHLTEEDCYALAGGGGNLSSPRYGGDGVFCKPWRTAEENCTGACCRGNPFNDSQYCWDVPPWSCGLPEDTWMGFDRRCDGVAGGFEGPGSPAVQCYLEYGACCYPPFCGSEAQNSRCRFESTEWCDYHCGAFFSEHRCEEWQDDGGPPDWPIVDCLVPGCCYFIVVDGANCCTNLDQAECESRGGQWDGQATCTSPPCVDIIQPGIPPCH